MAGVEKRLALGSYPAVTLTAARKTRDAAKLNKSEGRDPVQIRKGERLKATTADADTFKVTALEWYAMKLDSWSSHYAIREKRNLETIPAARMKRRVEGKKNGDPHLATYLQHRATMMQTWADYLNKLAKGADVIQFKAA